MLHTNALLLSYKLVIHNILCYHTLFYVTYLTYFIICYAQFLFKCVIYILHIYASQHISCIPLIVVLTVDWFISSYFFYYINNLNLFALFLNVVILV